MSEGEFRKITLNSFRKAGIKINPGIKRMIPFRRGVSPWEFISLPIDPFLSPGGRISLIEYKLRILWGAGILPEKIRGEGIIITFDEMVRLFEANNPGDNRVRRILTFFTRKVRREPVGKSENREIKTLARRVYNDSLRTKDGSPLIPNDNLTYNIWLLGGGFLTVFEIQLPEFLKEITSEREERERIFQIVYSSLCELILARHET